MQSLGLRSTDRYEEGADPVFTRPLSEDIAATVLRQLEETGLACIQNIIRPEYIESCRDNIRQLLAEKGERYFSLIQPWQQPSSVYRAVATHPTFEKLLSNLSVHAAGRRSVENVGMYNVLRIIAGDDHQSHSMMFHYDATTVTALMPIFIPDGPPEESGALVAIPNHRRFRRSVVVNLIEKMMVQNGAFRNLTARGLRGDRLMERIVRLEPGNLYLFWGYRTLHANLPAHPGSLRATMLFHYGNPHGRSLATRAVLWVRRQREGRNLRRKP